MNFRNYKCLGCLLESILSILFDVEELKELLSSSYDGDGSTYGHGNEDFLGIHYDVTFDHVETIDETGSLTLEIPYRPYKFDDNKWEEVRYLLVTVVKENGLYKISDYQLKE